MCSVIFWCQMFEDCMNIRLQSVQWFHMIFAVIDCTSIINEIWTVKLLVSTGLQMAKQPWRAGAGAVMFKQVLCLI